MTKYEYTLGISDETQIFSFSINVRGFYFCANSRGYWATLDSCYNQYVWRPRQCCWLQYNAIIQ